MTRAVESVDRYLAQIARADASRPIGRPAWLTRAARDAGEAFQSLGFPTTADEEWRFTSVAAIADGAFAPAIHEPAGLSRAALAPFQLTDLAGVELVFVNGRYAAERSRLHPLPPGVRIESLACAL